MVDNTRDTEKPHCLQSALNDLLCDYCQEPPELVTGKAIYPHRKDLYSKQFWLCNNCGAYVGTHKNSPGHKPLGRLANAELRLAKGEAHSAFDPLWRTGARTRTEAYNWLANQLGIQIYDCHIGMFNVATCKRVVDVCLDT